MKDWKLGFGVAGTAFLTLCCITPVLPWILGALGLTGLVGVLYRDTVLLPVLAGFVIFTGAVLWRRKSRK